MDDPMDQRLSAAGLRWQEDQPPPPDVPVQRLGESLRRGLTWRRGPAVAAAAALLVGGAVAVAVALSRDGDRAPRAADPTPTALVHRATKAVPFRDLERAHTGIAHGVSSTQFDGVTATGQISGTVHPGDTLAFDVALEAPGVVGLRPCPDYTITFGALTTTRQLNCAQVPYLASLVTPRGKVTDFRPVLPSGTQVFFRMRVTVPDEPGTQKVQWALDGPQEMPGFSGTVEVTPR
jgi:hypothetical protein